MRCPVCHSELKIGENNCYETLSDHVCSPNRVPPMRLTYVCDNDECPFGPIKVPDSWIEDFKKKKGIDINAETVEEVVEIVKNKRTFWDDKGNCYYNFSWYSDIIKRIKEVADKHMLEAIGSFARKIQVEIYKNDENHDLFRVGNWIFRIEYKYIADEDGNIISRKWKIRRLVIDSNCCTYKPFWFNDLFRVIYWDIKTIRAWRKNSEGWKNEVRNIFEPLPDWDKRGYRRIEKWYVNTFFKYVKNHLDTLDKISKMK